MLDQKKIEELDKILVEPVVCEDGRSHFIDENYRHYLSGQICQLFELKPEIPQFANEDEEERKFWAIHEIKEEDK